MLTVCQQDYKMCGSVSEMIQYETVLKVAAPLEGNIYLCLLQQDRMNWTSTTRISESSLKLPSVRPTFDAGHLLAAGPAVEVDLTGDWLLHFQKVWQEQDDLHFMVGQVSAAADALRSLDVWPAQKHHSGPLVDIFWGESEDIQQITRRLRHKQRQPT